MKVAPRSTIKLLVLLVLSGLFFLAGPLLAADIDYPTRPVNVVVGFAPGGAAYVGAIIVRESLPRYQTSAFYHQPPRQGLMGWLPPTMS